jgi:hypothetical protein
MKSDHEVHEMWMVFIKCQTLQQGSETTTVPSLVCFLVNGISFPIHLFLVIFIPLHHLHHHLDYNYILFDLSTLTFPASK